MSETLSTNPQAYRLVVEYDGTAYCGWQSQPNGRSVQDAMQRALEKIVRHPVRCDASGRTDSGVHARCQVVRFLTTAKNIHARAIVCGGNTELSEDIRILHAEPCSMDFDPRRHAVCRRYRYTILQREIAPALDRSQCAHIGQDLNWKAGEQALALFEGDNDFRTFRSSRCEAPRTQLTMKRARHIDRHPWHYLEFECRSYLHHQVRLMSGLIIDVARGKFPPSIVSEQLQAPRRTVQFQSAPAAGLTLMQVSYPQGVYPYLETISETVGQSGEQHTRGPS